VPACDAQVTNCFRHDGRRVTQKYTEQYIV